MDSIGIEFVDDLLSAEEEVELAKAIEAGVLAAEARVCGGFSDAGEQELIMLEQLGRQAMHRYVETNLKLVAMVVMRETVRSRMPESELFQEGCVGLLEAIRRFDHRRELRFATYALHWIRAYIWAMTANQAGGVNVPASRAERMRKLHGVEAELTQRLGREASPADVAVVVGKSPEWVTLMLSHRATQSLDEEEFADFELPDDSAALDFELILRSSLPGREVLTRLERTQRRVIEYRYGFIDGRGHSFSDTARELGIPISKVRRSEAKALEALRGVYPQQASVHLT